MRPLESYASRDFWSARITDAYRTLALRQGNTFYWFWIGNHDEMRDCSPDQFRAITYPHHSFSPQSQQLGPTAQVEPLHFKINSSRKGALKWNLTFRLKLTSAGQRLRSFYGKNACAMKSTWHSEAWTGDSSSNKHLKRAK